VAKGEFREAAKSAVLIPAASNEDEKINMGTHEAAE
jgi:hypothetical protein